MTDCLTQNRPLHTRARFWVNGVQQPETASVSVDEAGDRRIGERGAGLLVSVLLVPVVFFMIMLVTQYAMAAHARTVLAGAVQDGAAAGARLDATPNDGSALAEALIDDSISHLLTSHSVSVTATGEFVMVSASGTVVSIVPFVDGIDVSATATSPIEQFSPQGG